MPNATVHLASPTSTEVAALIEDTSPTLYRLLAYIEAGSDMQNKPVSPNQADSVADSLLKALGTACTRVTPLYIQATNQAACSPWQPVRDEVVFTSIKLASTSAAPTSGPYYLLIECDCPDTSKLVSSLPNTPPMDQILSSGLVTKISF
jgi:hypothetical protein